MTADPDPTGRMLRRHARVPVVVCLLAASIAAPLTAQDYRHEGLGFLPGATPMASYAYDIAGDGGSAAGYSNNAAGRREAFRWVSGSGLQQSYARGLSGDGNTVVGYSLNASGQPEAYRWTAGTGMQGLGFLPGSGVPASVANDASGDGRTVIGYSYNAASLQEAFRWTAGTGTASLQGLLAAEGVDLTDIQQLEATGISDDGSRIVGNMRNAASQTDAFLAVYDSRTAAVIAPTNYTTSVEEISQLSQAFGAQAHAGFHQLSEVAKNYELASTLELVTRGRARLPDLRYGAFAYGEVIRGSQHSDGQAERRDGAAGLMGQTASGFRFGLGVEVAEFERVAGALESAAEAGGGVGVAFLAYEPRETGLRASASASRLQLEADFDRNYLNGAAVETSTGSTDGSYSGAEVELGYRFRVASRSVVTPFLSYQYGRSAFDGYSETGGALPGVMSDQDAETRTAKVGVGGMHAVSDRMEVSAVIAYGRARETLSAPGLSVSGLSGMLFSGTSGDRDYDLASVSLGMNYALSGRATLYSSIESQQALDAVADDIDAVTAHMGMSFAF